MSRMQWGETGLSKEETTHRACELINRLYEAGAEQNMNERERDFYQSLSERFDVYGDDTFISAKQLYWLRDLVERYA